MNSAADAIGELNLGADDDLKRINGDQDAEDGDDDTDEDQQEGDLELDDEGDESDEPQEAIEAPVSLNAEEKAKFAALTKEAQQYVADLEARRATQVQTATTKASEAQRTA